MRQYCPRAVLRCTVSVSELSIAPPKTARLSDNVLRRTLRTPLLTIPPPDLSASLPDTSLRPTVSMPWLAAPPPAPSQLPLPQRSRMVAPPIVCASGKASLSALSVQLSAAPSPTMMGLSARAGGRRPLCRYDLARGRASGPRALAVHQLAHPWGSWPAAE